MLFVLTSDFCFLIRNKKIHYAIETVLIITLHITDNQLQGYKNKTKQKTSVDYKANT